MSINQEDSASCVFHAHFDGEEGRDREHSARQASNTRARGVATASSGSAADQSAQRTISASRGSDWTRVGDFITGRYDSSSGLWSASGFNRPYPTVPGSNRFLDSNYTTTNLAIAPFNQSFEDCLQNKNVHLSSKLPKRVWFLLAKSLGIKLNENDKPVVATIFHILTLVAAMAFAIPGTWYTVYDILSTFSKTTVLIGSVRIIIGFAWACLGVYAHNLAGRLFSNRDFVQCVRVHSKTFMKVKISWLTLLLGVVVVSINCYEAASSFYDDTCSRVETDILVCQVFFVGRVLYAIFNLLWNFIVAYVVFSVCRTHTIGNLMTNVRERLPYGRCIRCRRLFEKRNPLKFGMGPPMWRGIRRFMKELNMDARWYEDFCLNQYNIHRNPSSALEDNLDDSWFLWDDTIFSGTDEEATGHGIFLKSVSSFTNQRRMSVYQRRLNRTSNPGEDNPNFNDGGDTERDIKEEDGNPCATARDGSKIEQPDIGIEDSYGEADVFNDKWRKNSPVLFSNEDLLFSYWKFLRRLSVTSQFLQRWLASWITFVMIWDGYFIIYWTSHNASLYGIVEFVFPLLILLLVCSAYAEVNAEGQRLLKSFCPLEERLAILFYFNQQPLTIRVFSFTVTYNAMMTVILGFSVAFASRMVLDEITPS